KEGPEPFTLCGDVIEDRVEHELEMLTDAADVFPPTQVRVDGVVVDHREAVVRRGGVEGQQVNRAQRTRRIPVQEGTERPHVRGASLPHLISVCDQNRVALVQRKPQVPVGPASTAREVFRHQLPDTRLHRCGHGSAVEKLEVVSDRLWHRGSLLNVTPEWARGGAFEWGTSSGIAVPPDFTIEDRTRRAVA